LIVSQKLRASTSKKRSLYRTALSNVQIVVYKVNYCLGIFCQQVVPTWNNGFVIYGTTFPHGKWFSFICLSFHQKRWNSGNNPSEDGLRRRGTRRDCKGDVEYSPNTLRNSPTGRICVIQGIEPLVQDTEPEQPDSSSVIQSRGAVRNIPPLK
jgi:hypothetical protein